MQAYECEQGPSSHFISIVEDPDIDSPLISEEEPITDCQQDESKLFYESDNEEIFAIHDIGWKSYIADRPENKIAARQKMVMNGVYPPRLKDLSARKEN
jgi:hypothetical protein